MPTLLVVPAPLVTVLPVFVFVAVAGALVFVAVDLVAVDLVDVALVPAGWSP
jgi:hypothetical protein